MKNNSKNYENAELLRNLYRKYKLAGSVTHNKAADWLGTSPSYVGNNIVNGRRAVDDQTILNFLYGYKNTLHEVLEELEHDIKEFVE